MTGATSGAKCATTDYSWSNSDVFRQYLPEHFLPNIRMPTAEDPVLLLVDGHSSHVSKPLIGWARSVHLIIFILLANTAHILQLLDVSVLEPFKRFNSSECAQYMRNNMGMTINKYQICQHNCSAHLRAMVATDITAGFKKAGVYPLCQDAVNQEKSHSCEAFREHM